eukprot:1161206-Pelagomonas_calceolata.AAC.5
MKPCNKTGASKHELEGQQDDSEGSDSEGSELEAGPNGLLEQDAEPQDVGMDGELEEQDEEAPGVAELLAGPDGLLEIVHVRTAAWMPQPEAQAAWAGAGISGSCACEDCCLRMPQAAWAGAGYPKMRGIPAGYSKMRGIPAGYS